MVYCINIDLDASVGIEDALIHERFSVDTYKELLLLGYNMYKHGIKRALDGVVNMRITAELEMKHQTEKEQILQEMHAKLYQLQEENVGILKQCEDDKKVVEETTRKHYELHVEKLKLQLAHMQSVVEGEKERNKSLEAKMNQLYDDIYKDSIVQLKEAIKEKDMQITMLKNTNSVKGCIGESLLRDTLMSLYHDCEVVNMSKVSHVCDVHMVFPVTNAKMVFESKYKGVVDKKDICKFEDDMKHMGKDVMGGMFVSFLCKNIPGKGSLHIDVVPGTPTPLLYVAYENEEEFKLFFPQHCSLFVKVCDMHHFMHQQHGLMEDVFETVLEDVKACFDMLVKNKKRVEDMRTKFFKFCTEMEEDACAMIGRLESIISRNKQKARLTEKREKPQHVCEHCGVSFATKRGLGAHMKKH